MFVVIQDHIVNMDNFDYVKMTDEHKDQGMFGIEFVWEKSTDGNNLFFWFNSEAKRTNAFDAIMCAMEKRLNYVNLDECVF